MMQLIEPLRPDFWERVYTTGQLGESGEPSTLVLVLVRLFVVGFIFLLAGCANTLVRWGIRRSLERLRTRPAVEHRRLLTLYGLLTSALAYFIYFSAVILALFTVGVNWKGLAPLLGAASVLGLAIGFGAQKLIRDVITGLFILGEGQYDVGDWVTIGAVSGRVEEMGMRVTRLRDEQGRLCVIANGDITQVYNASRGPVKTALEVNVARNGALDQSLDHLREILQQTLQANAITTTGVEEPAVSVVQMDAAKVTVRLTAWVPVLQRQEMEDTLRRRVLSVAEAQQVTLA
jgi:small conductance mechanosensitive channel